MGLGMFTINAGHFKKGSRSQYLNGMFIMSGESFWGEKISVLEVKNIQITQDGENTKKEVTVTCEFLDGRKFLGTMKRKMLLDIQSRIFDRDQVSPDVDSQKAIIKKEGRKWYQKKRALIPLGICSLFVLIASTTPKPTHHKENSPSVTWPPKPTLPLFEARVAMKAYFDNTASRMPRVIGYTNLPDATEIIIELSRKDIIYSAQVKAVVSKGKFETGEFSSNGSDIPSGQYKVIITTPLPKLQPPLVRAKFGDEGENLKGELIRKGYLSKTLYYEEMIQLGAKISKVEMDSYLARKKIQQRQENALQESQISSAQYACQEYVRRQLNDPDSAEFFPAASYPATVSKNVFTVHVKVRARNAFNALRLGQFRCKILSSGDQWLLLKLSETR